MRELIGCAIGAADGEIGRVHDVSVDLDRDTIRRTPAYDPARPVDRPDEARLLDYYGPPRPWSPGDRAA